MISLAIHPIIHSSAIIVLCLFNNNPETAKENRWYPNGFNWLRGRDLNPRPPGYEPDELPTALPRVIILCFCSGTGDRTRTGTGITTHRILSPGCLPIPPLRLIVSKMAPRVGLEPTTYRLTAGCSAIELPRNDRSVRDLFIILNSGADVNTRIPVFFHLAEIF